MQPEKARSTDQTNRFNKPTYPLTTVTDIRTTYPIGPASGCRTRQTEFDTEQITACPSPLPSSLINYLTQSVQK